MLLNDLKLLLRFNSDSLFEEVSQTNMLKVGDSDISVFSDGSGYQMKNDQYLIGDGISLNGYALDITSSMTIGFWLHPISMGVAINPDNGGPTSITMPLLDFIEGGSSESSIFRITEQTSESGNNFLRITIHENEYTIDTQEYSPLMWHHFWIVYNGSQITAEIDGKESVLQNESGILRSNLRGYFLDLYINHSINGYSWNIAKNYGIIGDIFVFNTVNKEANDIQRVINDGVEFIVDDINTSKIINKSSIYFNDPETITITSLIDDMSYVFIGRNDGKILRGSPLLWEVRRSFSDINEYNILDISSDSLVDGFLQITNQIIRL